ncbi:MAG TPA: hemerythrin domain-containing protein [Pyrinomonadaceae bacterium]
MTNSIESLLGNDHESLAELLTELDSAFGKADAVSAFELLDLFWARLAVHIRAENLHLFPAIATAATSLFTGKGSLPTSEEAHNILLQLRSDHDFFMKELAQMIKVARELTGREEVPPREIKELRRRMTDIRKRLETHNLLEERLVYTWPSLLFDEKSVAALGDGLRAELENLPPRFVSR